MNTKGVHFHLQHLRPVLLVGRFFVVNLSWFEILSCRFWTALKLAALIYSSCYLAIQHF